MIKVTPKAAEKLKDGILTEEDGIFLRIYVQGGGCSGFQYGLIPAKNSEEADQTFESNGVKIIVDPISISYVKDAEIDFKDEVSGGGFIINNPDAKSTCGCGQSFNTE